MKTETQQKLDQDIPQDAVTTRSQAGVTLSYLTGGYVINRLNQVLGQGNWAARLISLNKVFEGVLKNYKGEDTYNTSYIANMEISANIDGKGVTFSDIGYGDGQDKKNPGKAHELAVKEASTDALKRAAKNLGISMGLGLYFKDGNYEIDKSETVVPETVQNSKLPTTSAEKSSTAPEKTSKSKKADPRSLIRASFNVLKDLKKMDKTQFSNDYLNGLNSKDLTDEQAELALTKIKTNFPELAL